MRVEQHALGWVARSSEPAFKRADLRAVALKDLGGEGEQGSGEVGGYLLFIVHPVHTQPWAGPGQTEGGSKVTQFLVSGNSPVEGGPGQTRK